MIIIKGLIIILSLLILPELLGLLILRFWKNEKNNIIFAFVLGYIIEFAIAQLITVPMIFAKCSYQLLLIIYTTIMLILAVTSIILNYKDFKEIFKISVKKLMELPKLLTIICCALIILQMYMYAGPYKHEDADDAYYVGTATTTTQTNTIFKYSPTTGATSGEQNALRYILGPFSIYYSIFSSWINIHPTIFAHEVLPVALLIVVYAIYALLGYELFDKNLSSTITFVILINILNMFGGYSVRTNFAFLLFRIWQGKAILANIILPIILLIFYKANKCEFNFISCAVLFLAVLAGTFTTTMGIALPTIEIGSLALINGIQNKNIKNIFKCFICCIPAIIYGMIYFIG